MSGVGGVDPAVALADLERVQRVTEADAAMDQGPWWMAVVHSTTVTLVALAMADVVSSSLFLLAGSLLNIAASLYLERRLRIKLRSGTSRAARRFRFISVVVAFAVIIAYWAVAILRPETLGFNLLPVGLIIGWFFGTGVMLAQWFVIERRRSRLVNS